MAGPGRQPIHLQAAGRLTPRERVWMAIRELRQDFSQYQLARRADVDDGTVATYLRSLVKAGYIERTGARVRSVEGATVSPAAFPEYLYRLARDVGVEAPRLTRDGHEVTQGRSREQMWRAMKALKTFTAAELAYAASTDEHRVSEEDAKDYLKHLRRAGYLGLAAPHVPGRAQARYQFIAARNTGPKAPMVQRVKQVYDPNLGKVVWSPCPKEIAR